MKIHNLQNMKLVLKSENPRERQKGGNIRSRCTNGVPGLILYRRVGWEINRRVSEFEINPKVDRTDESRDGETKIRKCNGLCGHSLDIGTLITAVEIDHIMCIYDDYNKWTQSTLKSISEDMDNHGGTKFRQLDEWRQ